MSTLPMSQPTNPNQTAGASLSPMTTGETGGVLGATVPSQTIRPSVGVAGAGVASAGTPFGVPTTSYGTLPTSSGGINPPSISSGLDTSDGSYTVKGDFKDVYGAGTGSTLVDILGNLGTAENSVFKAVQDNTLQAAERQKADMYASNAARGISPDSSSAALYNSDFDSQVNSNLMMESAGLQNQGLQTIISALTNEGQAHGSDDSAWETFGDVLNAGAGIAGTFFGGGFGAGGLTGGAGAHAATSGGGSSSPFQQLSSVFGWGSTGSKGGSSILPSSATWASDPSAWA